MADKLTRAQKIRLGELLGQGHRQFGLVTPRRPYPRDDEKGGAGSGNFFPQHPLFAQQPLGASSDLTFLINENSQSMEKAEERSDELTLQMQQKLEQKLGYAPTPHKAPEAKMY